jgi:hypothetical protein
VDDVAPFLLPFLLTNARDGLSVSAAPEAVTP